MEPAIQLCRVGKSFISGELETHALREIDLRLDSGGMNAVIGSSGSGKSTLLNLIAGIDRPTQGSVRIFGEPLDGLRESRLSLFRGSNIGIVFQFFQLIPTLNALENVVLAMDMVKIVAASKRRSRAMSLLERMGMERHSGKLPAQLSGGEQQRVAIARALANDPKILIADEPTGNLDARNSEIVMSLFQQCAEEGRTVLVATHERQGLDRYVRVLELADGNLVSDSGEQEGAAC